MHKRINFDRLDRFATVKMYQVYKEGNFVERKEISKCWEGNWFFQSGNTDDDITKFSVKLVCEYSRYLSLKNFRVFSMSDKYRLYSQATVKHDR